MTLAIDARIRSTVSSVLLTSASIIYMPTDMRRFLFYDMPAGMPARMLTYARAQVRSQPRVGR